MAVGYALLVLYSEGFRQARGEPELSLQSFTQAFEVVEGDAISHSSAMRPFFEDFEAKVQELLGSAAGAAAP